MNFAICGVFCYLCDLCCALCAVRCAQICTLQFVLMYFLILIFTIFKRQALMKKANLSRPRRYRRQNISQKKIGSHACWGSLWMLEQDHGVVAGGIHGFCFSSWLLPAKTSSAKFSHTTRLTCVNQCDSTPLNLQEPSSFFFEPRFVVLPLLLRRKAQSVEAIAAPWGS